MIKPWNYDLVEPHARKTPRSSGDKSLLARCLGLVRRQREPTAVASRRSRTVAEPFEGSLRERLEQARAARSMNYAPARAWSPKALKTVRAVMSGGGEQDRLPEARDHPYELRVLHTPGQSAGGAESRWYRDDKLALAAFQTARSLLADPELGLGLAMVRDGCLVYEWTESADSDRRDLDVAAHLRRGCRGHAEDDVFDRLARLYDHYCALGYREGGQCSLACVSSCPGEHGNLLLAMLRAEANELDDSAPDDGLPPLPGGSDRVFGRRRSDPGLLRPRH